VFFFFCVSTDIPHNSALEMIGLLTHASRYLIIGLAFYVYPDDATDIGKFVWDTVTGSST
jgi:hypothetical protein